VLIVDELIALGDLLSHRRRHVEVIVDAIRNIEVK